MQNCEGWILFQAKERLYIFHPLVFVTGGDIYQLRVAHLGRTIVSIEATRQKHHIVHEHYQCRPCLLISSPRLWLHTAAATAAAGPTLKP